MAGLELCGEWQFLPAVTNTEKRDSATVSQILSMSESRVSVRLSAMGTKTVQVWR